MEATVSVAAIRRTELIRKFWWFMLPTTVTGIVASVISSVAFFIICIVRTVPGSSSVVFVIGTLLSLFAIAASCLLRQFVMRQLERRADNRFSCKLYDHLIRSLKTLGIKNPALYIATHEREMDAFKKVRFAALSVVESELIRETGRGDVNIIFERSNEIAFMVLPGELELSRELRLMHLIEDRRIVDFDMLRELVKQTDDQPLALSIGAL